MIDYTNHKGKRALRTVKPKGIWFGAIEWHPEPQWLLTAHDVEKNELRYFAMRNIHEWK